jgi:hypothetical protein
MRINEAIMLPRIPLLGDALFRLIDVNARYYGTLGRVTAEFLREVAVALEGVPRASEEVGRYPSEEARRYPSEEVRSYPGDGMRGHRADPMPYQPHEAPPAPPAPVHAGAPKEAIILLEAEADHTAIGVFLVANHLNHEILARPEVSPFYDPPGTTSVPRLVFEPEMVRLAPQERVLIKILATADRSMQPDVRYRCEVSVPALAGTRVPVVVRRSPDRQKVVEVNGTPPPETAAAEHAPAGHHAAMSTAPAHDTSQSQPRAARRIDQSRKRPRKSKKTAAKE